MSSYVVVTTAGSLHWQPAGANRSGSDERFLPQDQGLRAAGRRSCCRSNGPSATISSAYRRDAVLEAWGIRRAQRNLQALHISPVQSLASGSTSQIRRARTHRNTGWALRARKCVGSRVASCNTASSDVLDGSGASASAGALSRSATRATPPESTVQQAGAVAQGTAVRPHGA